MANTAHSTDEDLTAWERTKKALANDWEQTKADFGVDGARDMGQDVDDTLKQAADAEDAFENHEQAFRFGYDARQRHGDATQWSPELDAELRSEYEGDYDADRDYIEHAYRYRPR